MSAEEEDEELSSVTLFVLAGLGLFFACSGVVLIWRAFGKCRGVSRPSQEPEQSQCKQTAPRKSANFAAEALPQQPKEPAKPGVSLKKLVKQHNAASSRQVAADKPVEHPLYLNSVKGFHSSVSGISFSTTGELATVSEDRVLKVFAIDDVTSKSFSSQRTALKQEPVDVAFGAASDIFVLTAGGLDSACLEKYDYKGGRFAQAWEVKEVHRKEPGKCLQAGVTHPHGHSLVLSCSSKSDLQVYNSNGTQLAGLNSSGLQNHGAAMSRQARFFGASTFTSDVKLHEIQYTREGDFSRVKKVMDLKYAHKGQIYCLSFSPDGKRAVTASKDGTWAVWNIDVRYQLEEDPKILLHREQETGDARYTLVAYGPDNIIAAAFGTTLHFLDGGKQGTLLESVDDAHDALITSLEWSPVEHKFGKQKTALLATSGRDKRVRLWRAPLL